MDLNEVENLGYGIDILGVNKMTVKASYLWSLDINKMWIRLTLVVKDSISLLDATSDGQVNT